MSFEVLLIRRAQQDFQNIIDWLSQNTPALLTRWFDSYQGILDRLEREPLGFGFAPEGEILNSPIRQAIFRTGKGFVHRLLFIVTDEQVRVLHIRGPGQDYIAHTV